MVMPIPQRAIFDTGDSGLSVIALLRPQITQVPSSAPRRWPRGVGSAWGSTYSMFMSRATRAARDGNRAARVHRPARLPPPAGQSCSRARQCDRRSARSVSRGSRSSRHMGYLVRASSWWWRYYYSRRPDAAAGARHGWLANGRFFFRPAGPPRSEQPIGWLRLWRGLDRGRPVAFRSFLLFWPRGGALSSRCLGFRSITPLGIATECQRSPA